MGVINSNKFNFAEVLDNYLRYYQDGVVENLNAAIRETAKEAVKKLKAESPRGTGPSSGEYAANWKYKFEYNGKRWRKVGGAVVYGGKPTYRLAHLLEHGHAKRGGGRVEGIVHIEPVAEWAYEEAVNKFLDKMEDYIE